MDYGPIGYMGLVYLPTYGGFLVDVYLQPSPIFHIGILDIQSPPEKIFEPPKPHQKHQTSGGIIGCLILYIYRIHSCYFFVIPIEVRTIYVYIYK